MKDYISYVSKNKFLGLLIILTVISFLINSTLHIGHAYRVNAKSKLPVFSHKSAMTTKLMSVSNNHSMNTKKVIDLDKINHKHKIYNKQYNKPVVKPKPRWVSLGIKRITYYCAGCNDPKGSYQSASGLRLREGYVAMNGVRLGSTIELEGHTYKVVDRVGRSDTVDIFIDTTVCRCKGLFYKQVNILV